MFQLTLPSVAGSGPFQETPIKTYKSSYQIQRAKTGYQPHGITALLHSDRQFPPGLSRPSFSIIDRLALQKRCHQDYTLYVSPAERCAIDGRDRLERLGGEVGGGGG